MRLKKLALENYLYQKPDYPHKVELEYPFGNSNIYSFGK